MKSPRFFFIWALIGSGMVWLLTPFAIEIHPGSLDQLRFERTPVRYGLVFLSLTTVFFCVGIEYTFNMFKLKGLGIGILWFLLGVLFVMVLLNPKRGLTLEVMRGLSIEVTESLLFTANFLLVVYAFSLTNWESTRKRTLFIGIFLAIGGGISGTSLSLFWHQRHQAFYNVLLRDTIFSEMVALKISDRMRVCVLDDRPYPFFGSYRQFQVYTPFYLSNPEELASFLRNFKVDLLVVRADGTSNPSNVVHNYLATAWASDEKKGLELFREGPSYRVYRVKP